MQPTELDGGKANNTARAQLTRLILRLQEEEKKDLCRAGSLDPEPLPVGSAQQPREQTSHNLITCGAVSLSVLLSLLAFFWMWRDFQPADAPEWKPVLALAEVAREKGEFYDAKALYTEAGRFAAWRDDWPGLLAAACGLGKLESKVSRYSERQVFLLRAMAAAEKKQSRTGMAAVARAFSFFGERELASVATSRVRQNWAAEDAHSTELALSGCWNEGPDHTIDLTGE
jgi:hypothetical protein